MRDNMIYFTAGLPRSGSTLLQNLLAQNPAFHATATNDLAHLVSLVRDAWTQQEGFRAQGLGAVEPRVRGTIAGMLRGFYARELAGGKTVFDKSRSWPSLIEVVEAALGRTVKVILTVRDVREVVASLERVYRKGFMTRAATMRSLSDRVNAWMDGGSMIGAAVRQVLDAFERGLADRLIVVPYEVLSRQPRQAMEALHALLGVEPFEYTPTRVEQKVSEDDTVYGLDLHTVRPVVEGQDPYWHAVLTQDIAAKLDAEYADLQALSRMPSVVQGELIYKKG